MNRATSTAAFQRDFRQVAGGVRSYSSGSAFRVPIEPAHIWWRAFFLRLDELCKLEVGWDGCRAPPVSFSNAYFAVALLDSICPVGVSAPQLVPGPNADIQIEWHTRDTDIELHIRAPYDVDAWRLAPSTAQDGESFQLRSDFAVVTRWLAAILEPSIAAPAAAA